MVKYSNANLESIYFNAELGYLSSLMNDKIHPKKKYSFGNIKNVSITPWYHNSCNHLWDIKKNSIILIELPRYEKIFYLLNTPKLSKESFIDKSLDAILNNEKSFSINALRSAYPLISKDNLIFPISKNISGLEREFYLFKSLMFNLGSIDLFYEKDFTKYNNIEIVIGNNHAPSLIYLIKKFSYLNAISKEAVGNIKELSCFENYENYNTISSFSSKNLINCLMQINEALMLT